MGMMLIKSRRTHPQLNLEKLARRFQFERPRHHWRASRTAARPFQRSRSPGTSIRKVGHLGFTCAFCTSVTSHRESVTRMMYQTQQQIRFSELYRTQRKPESCKYTLERFRVEASSHLLYRCFPWRKMLFPSRRSPLSGLMAQDVSK